MDCSAPGFPVHHQLWELAQTHVHRAGDVIQPSHPLSSPFSSWPQSFPGSDSFPKSQLFPSVSQSIQRRQWQPTPVLLPGKSHERRSLGGCSPRDCEESDMTERLHFHFSLSCTGEGNGNPLQCSCLENPRDGGAWWAAVYGVTQSRT